jgi:hypothetical protein
MAADTGWIACGSIATGVMAVVTAAMAWKTRDLAKAGQDEANASLALVRETQRDRELAYTPVLTLTGVAVADELVNGQAILRNIGAGPALNCTGVFRPAPNGDWKVTTDSRDIPIGELAPAVRLQSTQSDVDTFFDGSDEHYGAIYCMDVLGRRHRFLVELDRRNQLVIVPDGNKSYRLYDEPAPSWVNETLIWRNRL